MTVARLNVDASFYPGMGDRKICGGANLSFDNPLNNR